MSLSDVPEVQQFWESYERALVVDRRIIEMQVVRQAVEAITALEAEVKELQHELTRLEQAAAEVGL